MRPIAALFLVVLASAADKPALPQGDKFTAKLTGDGYSVEVLLPEGVLKEPTVAALAGELKDKVTAAGLRDGKQVRVAILSLKGASIPAGDYKLDLIAGRNRFPISVTIPAAGLNNVPAKLQLKLKYLPWVGSIGWMARPEMSVPLAPADPKAHLTGMQASMAETFLKDGGSTPGSLKIELDPRAYDSSAAPQVPTLKLSAAADFERGESQGKVRVVADQFAQPVAIPISVVSEPTSLVLIPFLIAGLWLGYLLRTKMEERIAKKNALIDASRFLAKADQELASNQDPDFQKDVKIIKAAVESKLSAKAADLRKEVEAAGPKLVARVANFQTDKMKFLDGAQALCQIVGRKYELPREFTKVIQDAQTALTEVLKVDRNNLTAARELLKSAEEKLMLGAQAASGAWDSQWKTTEDIVERLPPLLLAEDRARVQADFDPAEKREGKVRDFHESTDPSRQELLEALKATHSNNEFRPQFLKGLPIRLGTFIDRLDREVKDRKRATAPQWVAWRAAAGEAVKALQAADLTNVPETLRELRDKLDETIRQLGASLEQEQQQKLLDALNEGHWIEAIQLIKKGEELASETTQAAPGPSRPVSAAPPVVVTGSEPAPPSGQPRMEPLPSETELQAEVERLEAWKRVAVGALILLFGWIVLGASFKGEPLEYLTAFGWAFLTDLTTTNLIATLTPFKEKVKA